MRVKNERCDSYRHIHLDAGSGGPRDKKAKTRPHQGETTRQHHNVKIASTAQDSKGPAMLCNEADAQLKNPAHRQLRQDLQNKCSPYEQAKNERCDSLSLPCTRIIARRSAVKTCSSHKQHNGIAREKRAMRLLQAHPFGCGVRRPWRRKDKNY